MMATSQHNSVLNRVICSPGNMKSLVWETKIVEHQDKVVCKPYKLQ